MSYKIGSRQWPIVPNMCRFIAKVPVAGSITDVLMHESSLTVRLLENTKTVAENMRERIYQHQLVIVIENWTFHARVRILQNDLCMPPYKMQLVQELKPHDHSLCFHLHVYLDFAKKKKKKLFFHMKLISILIDTLISINAIFGV